MAHFREHRLDVVQVCAVQEKEINGRQGDHNYRHNAQHGPMIESGFKKALTLAGRGPSHGRELRQAAGAVAAEGRPPVKGAALPFQQAAKRAPDLPGTAHSSDSRSTLKEADHYLAPQCLSVCAAAARQSAAGC